MAVVARKQTPPSAASRIEAAQAALEETNRKLAELNEQRNAALLRDDNGAAVAFGIELANLRLAARADEDKIGLLREAAAREEQARRAKEKEALIGKIEKLLAGRDAAGRELADAVAAADRAFRKLIDIGVEVQNMWSWPASDVPAILLSPAAIAHALSGEMYRIGARPKVGGGQVEPHGVHAGVDFPGSRVPRFELTHLPEKIPPLTAVLQQASAHASNIMRGVRPSAEVEVPHVAARHEEQIRGGAAQVGSSAPAPPDNGNAVPLTTAQERLAGLLKRQAELAEDPAHESEYFDAVAAVAVAQAELDAEQRVGAQQHG
jgi:hypothetical protein